ncbi:MAG TPA: hypothetical protein VK753_11175 [Xanthomonadaceae bacterium]|nr:hypothetical protein [Xanthomonadaceae bacterium]
MRPLIREGFGDTVLAYVDAVTDNKTLPKGKRKRLQIEHAAPLPHGAELVKLADKIANLRGMADCPPTDWSHERIADYFKWATAVVASIRGTHSGLEALFDAVHTRLPK